MKAVSMRDLRRNLSRRMDECQEAILIVLRWGRPAAVLVGVEGVDGEQVLLQTDDSLWRLLHRRRMQKAEPMAAVKRRLRIR